MDKKEAIALSILAIVIALLVAGFIYANFFAPGEEEEEEDEAEKTTEGLATAISFIETVSGSAVPDDCVKSFYSNVFTVSGC